VKKHLRAQEIALQNRLPCGLPGRLGGAFLPEQDNVFPDASTSGASSTTRRRCRRRGFPKIAAVMGSCTAGGAYVPAMSDECIIVKGHGTIFLGGPPLVKAATGEARLAGGAGGAEVHTRQSGVADHIAQSDAHALALVRGIVAHLGRATGAALDVRSRPSRFTPRGIARRDTRGQAQPYDVRESIARIVDGSELDEFQAGLRHHTGHRIRAHLGLPGGHSSRTTASCSRNRR